MTAIACGWPVTMAKAKLHIGWRGREAGASIFALANGSASRLQSTNQADGAVRRRKEAAVVTPPVASLHPEAKKVQVLVKLYDSF